MPISCGHCVEIFPYFRDERDTVATVFERPFMFDLTGNINPLAAGRFGTTLKIAQLAVHVALKVGNITHRVDAHRAEPVAGNSAGLLRSFGFT